MFAKSESPPMPSYTPNRIMLLVDDMPACVTFYRDVLGFTPAVLVENDVYAEFDTGSVRLSLYGRAMLAGLIGTQDLPAPSTGQDRLLISIAVEDVDAAYHDLTAQGVDLHHAAHRSAGVGLAHRPLPRSRWQPDRNQPEHPHERIAPIACHRSQPLVT